MITMVIFNDIKYYLNVQGYSYKKVHELTGCTYNTVRKYSEMEDLSSKLKTPRRKSKLEPFKKIIRKYAKNQFC